MKITFALLFIAFSFCISAQKVFKYELDSLEKLDRVTTLLNDSEKKEEAIPVLSLQIQMNLGHGPNKKMSSIRSNRWIDSQKFVAYYYRGELVFFMNYYHENSRMGSCGDIDIENFYHIEKDKITQTWHFEWPFACYNHSPMNMEAIKKIAD